LVGAPDGRTVKVSRRAPRAEAATLGVSVADALRNDGGAELLAEALGGAAGG
jgi:hypothetical protein